MLLDVDLGGPEQFEQHILGRDLEDRPPGAVVVAARLRELAPDLEGSFAAQDRARRRRLADAVVERVSGWIDSLRRSLPEAKILVLGLARPRHPAFGLAEAHAEDGEIAAVDDLNRRLRDACRAGTDTFFVDLDRALSGVGYAHSFDDRMEAHARQPFAPAAVDAVAHALARTLAAALTPRRKCLVLDCDNTLWGGILGEDGPDGIALGEQHPGSAFVRFQQAILGLHKRGIILALASRNNEDDVLEVLDSHPHQVLRRDHFASWRINWNDKATSIEELAGEINIGLDSIVFVDDSDFECDLVRRRLPEVLTRKTPADPLSLSDFIGEMAEFDALTVSAEDLARGLMYRAQVERNRVRQSAPSLQEFLASLEMQLQIKSSGPAEAERIAQLSQRTNQFNLTTRRYSPARIQEIMSDPDWHAFHLRLRDRFGDYGLCGVCLLHRTGPRVDVDTFLLSCRVIGRSVEQAAVAFVQRWARYLGADELIGGYEPTAKNELVANLWPRLGFAPAETTGDRSTWRWLTGEEPIEFPGCFALDLQEPRETNHA